MKTTLSYRRIIFAIGLLLFAVQTLHPLGKTGADPGAPAGGGDFVAGNAAVAADVNRQINLLYKAFNDGANSINIDGWTNTTSNLGYTGGNIGIGIASPLAKFQVNGGSAVTLAGATGFGVFGATTGNHVAIDSTQIQAKSNATTASNLALNPYGGSVGINTGSAAPSNVLEIISSVSTVARGLGVTQYSNTVSGPGIFLRKARGTAAAPSAVLSGDQISSMIFLGYDGTAFFTGAYINPLAAENWTTTAHGSNITFGTVPVGSTSLSERMRIDDAGNVGIGITNPGEILDVGGNIKSSGRVIVTGANLTDRKIEIQTAGVRRWSLGADAADEDGVPANDGSNFEIRRFQDGGGTFGNPIVLKFTRSSGLLQLPLYNAGTLTSDASGNITASSDGRMKDIIGHTETGLSEVLQMYGKRWRWKPGMGMETQGVYEGFIAQDVERLVPLAVGGKADGMKSLAYHALLPTFANAIRELKSEKDTQVLALEKRAAEAEQKYAALLKQVQQEKAQADARTAKLELRLVRLEASLEKNRVVARR